MKDKTVKKEGAEQRGGVRVLGLPALQEPLVCSELEDCFWGVQLFNGP